VIFTRSPRLTRRKGLALRCAGLSTIAKLSTIP
jgi:hypothetical protein